MKHRTLYYANDHLRLLDQTLLPGRVSYVDCSTHHDVIQAIRTLQVRGAPALGIAAAYAVVLAVKHLRPDPPTWEAALAALDEAGSQVVKARPTAVNPGWAVKRLLNHARDVTAGHPFDLDHLRHQLLREADRVLEEDRRSCELIGRAGLPLVRTGCNVLTYCNAGALAASELGTALAPVYLAHQAGRAFVVYCCETRPLLQGSRLTAWELCETGVDTVLVCDNMVGHLFRQKRINLVIVGADRIARNGDTANKIGTYGLAVLARHHNIPFYVAAPVSTMDRDLTDGKGINIETRHPDEVRTWAGNALAPAQVTVYNPAFDVTPAELITALLTDKGTIQPVNEQQILNALAF